MPTQRATTRNRPTRPGQSTAVRQKRIARQPARRSFIQRNRDRLVAVVIVAGLAALGGAWYANATTPVYSCATQWTAPETPSPAPGATPRIGYPQDDMGRTHAGAGSDVRYLFCPPASGPHYNASGQGPIQPKVYGPNDQPVPPGWIHNLEHGALVLLYKCDGTDACTDAGQAALRQFYQSFPTSPICHIPAGAIGPVVARFDQMAYPYAALLWDQVLPLQTLDTQQILAFFAQQGERTNPEPQCSRASSSPVAPSAPATAAPTPAAPSPAITEPASAAPAGS